MVGAEAAAEGGAPVVIMDDPFTACRPRSAVSPRAWPRLKPPPATQCEKRSGLWPRPHFSRPESFCRPSRRPISPQL